MTFSQPLWLLVAVILGMFYWFCRNTERSGWSRIMPQEVLGYLGGTLRRQLRLPAFLIAAIAALALASPSTRSDHAESYRYATGWIVLADISRSMTIDDVAPSRLSALRNIAEQLGQASAASPVALIAYAGDAFLVAPPAIDKAFYTNTTTLLEHGLLELEGSNLTRALSLATSVIASSHWINARIVILTDTGGINARAEAAVARLASSGHSTDVIVFGSGQASANAEFDLDAGAALADTGAGRLHQVDSLGRLDLSAFNDSSVDRTNTTLIQSGIAVLHRQNQSHWVLLLCVPLLLLMFARTRS